MSLASATTPAVRQGRIDVNIVARWLVGGVYAVIGILLFLGLETSIVLLSLVMTPGVGAIIRAMRGRY